MLAVTKEDVGLGLGKVGIWLIFPLSLKWSVIAFFLGIMGIMAVYVVRREGMVEVFILMAVRPARARWVDLFEEIVVMHQFNWS